MSNDLLNILSNSNKDIDNQKLMDYISGKLSGVDKHEVEQWMIDNNFESEALEGLQTVKDHKNLQAYVDQLNKDLNKYLQQKKQRRNRRKIKESPWAFVAIILVLLLVIIAYLVIQKLGK
jgi:ABC-type bacteriocin/lantibiotic exporter with double-glycine peptidase domain